MRSTVQSREGFTVPHFDSASLSSYSSQSIFCKLHSSVVRWLCLENFDLACEYLTPVCWKLEMFGVGCALWTQALRYLTWSLSAVDVRCARVWSGATTKLSEVGGNCCSVSILLRTSNSKPWKLYTYPPLLVWTAFQPCTCLSTPIFAMVSIPLWLCPPLEIQGKGCDLEIFVAMKNYLCN